jgi:hypothetical protein
MQHNTSFLDTEITFLKGVGPERAKTLANELNIRTFPTCSLIFLSAI